MSAAVLGEAAKLMRSRAKNATDGPWFVPDADDEYVGPTDVVGDGEPGNRYIICERAGMDAEHIASWHPLVALAVADWLEHVAKSWWAGDHVEEIDALKVARAYLGGVS